MRYNKYNYRIPGEYTIRVITDTDAKNEADDQFAIVHALLTPRFDNRGIIAAHFGNQKSSTSMEDSYNEILKVLELMDMEPALAYKGAKQPLPDENTPVCSKGAELIIEEALKDDSRPLFVTFLGPLTDIASAYLLEPRIADRLTVIWIGGEGYPAGGDEYNLSNDVNAANVVFKSKMPLWQVPKNVYQKVLVSIAELECRVKPRGEIGDYLFTQLEEYQYKKFANPKSRTSKTGEQWCLGDSPAVGLLLFDHPHSYEWRPAPEFTREMYYIHNGKNRAIRVYKDIDPRFIMEDFYCKLELFAQKSNR